MPRAWLAKHRHCLPSPTPTTSFVSLGSILPCAGALDTLALAGSHENLGGGFTRRDEGHRYFRWLLLSGKNRSNKSACWINNAQGTAMREVRGTGGKGLGFIREAQLLKWKYLTRSRLRRSSSCFLLSWPRCGGENENYPRRHVHVQARAVHTFFFKFSFFRTYWNCFSARCRVGTACGKHRRCGLSFTRTRSCAIAYPGKVLKYRRTCNFSPFNLYCEIIMHKVLFVEGFIAKRQFVFLCVDKIFNSKYLARWIHWEEM